MQATEETLWLAAVVVAAAAGALSHIGARAGRQRSIGIIAAGLWLNSAALALLAAGPHASVLSSLAQGSWLAWPVLSLIGLRRFHARTPLSGNERADATWLALALLVSVVAAIQFASHWPVWAGATFTALYAALRLCSAAPGADAAVLRRLAPLWPAAALLPALGAGPGRWPWEQAPTALQIGCLAFASLALSFVVSHLSSQRTELELRNSRRRLRTLANIDMLTQVPNRRRFGELARRALLEDAPGSAALLLIDIDHFKQINDKLGHAAGDRALRLVSRCALDLLRSHDVVGRHGGDEFVLLLRDSSTDDAMSVAERLVRHLQLQSHAHALPRLSLSFGIVQMRAGEAIDDVLQRADLALYEAKRQGRSRAVAAHDDEEQGFRSSQRLGLTPR